MGILSVGVVGGQLYRPWMAWVFATGDVILLLAAPLHTAFVLEEGAALMLASPAAIAFGVVLSLQALRYNPALQIFISVLLLAVISLALLIGGPGAAPATLATEEFFGPTPNAIRLAIFAILAGVIGVAVTRSRRLVYRIATETEQRLNLTRFLPPEIAGRMSDSGLAEMRAGQRRELVIMFVDLRGFTAFSDQHSPEEAGALLTRFRGLILDAVVDRHGVVDKFIGDGALIVFGLDRSADEAAKDGFDAGMGILQAMEAWSAERIAEGRESVRAIVALHRGDAIVGALGDSRRLEFSALGRVVNEAARLEALGKAHEMVCVISRDVFRAEPPGAGALTFLRLPDEQLRGREASIVVFGARGGQGVRLQS